MTREGGAPTELWVLFRAAETGPPERGELKDAVRVWLDRLLPGPEINRLRAWFDKGWVLLNVAETGGFPMPASLAPGDWTHLVFLFAEEPGGTFEGMAEETVREAARGLAEFLGGTIHDPRGGETGDGRYQSAGHPRSQFLRLGRSASK